MEVKLKRIAVGEPWSATDRKQITAHGLTVEEVERQLKVFQRGVPRARLNRPCRAGDGIIVLSETDRSLLPQKFEEACRTHRIMKFVPASGAASRMFHAWYRCLENGGFAVGDETDVFSRDLRRFAFFRDLEAAVAAGGDSLDKLLESRDTAALMRYILTERGLNYGGLPKALLKFHSYPDGSRTASRSTWSRRLSTRAMPTTFPGSTSRSPLNTRRPSGRFCRGPSLFMSRVCP